MINNNVFERTRKNLILTIMLVVEIFMILVSIFIFNYFKVSVLSNIDLDLQEEYKFVSNAFNKDSILNPIILQDPRDIVYIYEGDQIRYYTQNRYFNQMPTVKTEFQDEYTNEMYSGFNFRTFYVKTGKYQFRIMRNIDSEMQGLSHLVTLLILSDSVSLLLSYIIAKFLSKKALRPIETSWNNQVKFIQDASHELRTPVAIIQSKLESLMKTPDNTIEEEAETIAVAMRETRQLKKMISELLSLTKEESIIAIHIESIDLMKLFEEMSESYDEIAEYQDKVFSYDAGSLKNTIIYTDRTKLVQLLRILVDNAFKYTNKNDSIKILAMQKGRDRITLEVRDTGIGISARDQKRVFERFFRSDAVRAEDIEGSGIGLSIAKLITNTLGGNIRLKSKLGEGTSFIIDLPRGKPVKSREQVKKTNKNKKGKGKN